MRGYLLNQMQQSQLMLLLSDMRLTLNRKNEYFVIVKDEISNATAAIRFYNIDDEDVKEEGCFVSFNSWFGFSFGKKNKELFFKIDKLICDLNDQIE